MSTSLASVSSLVSERQDPPAQPATLGDLLRSARAHSESGIGFALAEGNDPAFLSYATVIEQARCIAGSLRAAGRRPGDKLALLLERADDFVVAFWACVLGGYVPCPLMPIRNDTDRWDKHLRYLNELLDGPLLITTGSQLGTLPIEAADITELREGLPLKLPYKPQPDDPALVMLTSGSTGTSKAVILTHANIIASMLAKSERRRLTHDDIVLNWVPFDHVTALLESHLIAVHSASRWLHVPAARILAEPLLLLRLVDRHRVTSTLIPNFLLGQINAGVETAALRGSIALPASLDLSCLRHIITGGEANVVETGRRFLELLAPYGLSRHALWPGFGMTETCAGVVYSSQFPDIDTGREFASVGFSVSGLQLRIVDEDGAALSHGNTGELQLRGPMIFSRYHKNEQATRAAFATDGWLRTGDLGCLDDAGRLNLVGRSKDCIIVSGVNYFSHELEAVLEQLDGIERSYVAAFPMRPRGADTEQLVVAFAASCAIDDEPGLHRLAVAVRNTTVLLWGFRPALVLPLPKEAFPKTSLGKIQRTLMRKQLEAGDFARYEAHIADIARRQMGSYQAPRHPAEVAVAEIFAEMFGLPAASLSASASFFDLGGTSLDIVKLTQKLGQRFQLAEIPITIILQNPTIAALAARMAPGDPSSAPRYNPIVPMQLTGSKTPVFCIHPASGEVLVFVSLANYFVNDRPFYALRARGLNEGEQCFSSFEEMVRTYVAAIRERQPHGPYAIAGYSFGGPVAFEVAKVLESQGEQVPFVGSIDMPPQIPYAFDVIDIVVGFALFLSLIDKRQFSELPDRIRAEGYDPYEYLIQLASPARLAELDLDLRKFKAWAALTFDLVTTILAYVPRDTVDSMTVFRARPLWSSEEGWAAELQQWDRFTRKPNRYIDVDGEHHTLMDPAFLPRFQGVLRSEIDRALAGR